MWDVPALKQCLADGQALLHALPVGWVTVGVLSGIGSIHFEFYKQGIQCMVRKQDVPALEQVPGRGPGTAACTAWGSLWVRLHSGQLIKRRAPPRMAHPCMYICVFVQPGCIDSSLCQGQLIKRRAPPRIAHP